ncbi:HPr kinase/phosphorylase [Aliiruegeria sabulilitoris]|uniref:HPr kinase/phosphorylase n=1 Tax=Aliiruegeria sabulilitoris TaxID=1510458 RepID=UPI00083346BA|nr:HPr kinase/phosphatase C-terminal domain-containing protein [Aliiruegeria sabulilitoris]NDR56834.1 hypothetical protein [Pseudoruegeria sp. M32A2M]
MQNPTEPAEQDPPLTSTRFHASTVALHGRALLITGPAGSGKSTLALEMISLGAELVADDQTQIRLDQGRLLATPHPNIAGMIEARHVGLLRLPYCPEAEVALVLDLGQAELHRLPPRRHLSILGQKVILLHRPPGGHAATALYHCLLQRRDTP